MVIGLILLSGCLSDKSAVANYNLGIYDDNVELNIISIKEPSLRLLVKSDNCSITINRNIVIELVCVEGKGNIVWVSHSHGTFTWDITEGNKNRILFYD